MDSVGDGTVYPFDIQPLQPPEVALLGQSLRLEPAHLAGAGSFPLRALPAHDHSHGGGLGKALGIIGVIIAGQATVEGLA
jgi:hypothetical protein